MSLALGRMLLAADHAEEAIEVISNIPDDSKLSVDKETLLGVSFAATHAVNEAVPHLRSAVRAEPRNALAENVLGFCLYQQGHYTDAAQAYDAASELEPARVLYARDAAMASERADRLDDAIRFAERASAQQGATAADHILLGKLYAMSNRLQPAIKELSRAFTMDPDSDNAAYLLARTYMRSGDTQDAKEWAGKLADLKRRHSAQFAAEKSALSSPISSSHLLEGGALGPIEAESR